MSLAERNSCTGNATYVRWRRKIKRSGSELFRSCLYNRTCHIPDCCIPVHYTDQVKDLGQCESDFVFTNAVIKKTNRSIHVHHTDRVKNLGQCKSDLVCTTELTQNCCIPVHYTDHVKDLGQCESNLICATAFIIYQIVVYLNITLTRSKIWASVSPISSVHPQLS